MNNQVCKCGSILSAIQIFSQPLKHHIFIWLKRTIPKRIDVYDNNISFNINKSEMYFSYWSDLHDHYEETVTFEKINNSDD